LLREPPALPLTAKRGDFDLNPDQRPVEAKPLAPAAVLVPIVQRAEPTVLLTQRTEHLTRHAGQVSFPGGRVNEGDISLVETALRETQEETGIAPTFITVAGFLDVFETGTGYAILPVVGLLAEGFALSPSADTRSGKSAPQIPGPLIAEMRTRSGVSFTAPELMQATSASRRHASRSPER